ncbi:MAG TPA: methyl-accepting chemotaxis protein, partial [Bacteroidota bacterium]|nr:methyl-accepting chemotaxis protein [Bacteroidota bacterium]
MTFGRWRDWGLSTKIIAVSFAAAVPIVGIIAAYALPRIERAIYDEKIQATKNLVEVTYALIAEYDARVHKGEFPLEEGQKRASGRIQQLRYNEKDYFWINDLTPTMIMHPFKPELDGKDVSDMKSPDGRRIFIEMVDLCRGKGEGALEYLWPRPGDDKPVPKVAYLKLYRPWGWIVGSGIYIDDIDAQMNSLRATVLVALGMGLAMAIAIGALVGHALKRRVTGLVQRMESADLNTRIEAESDDEIGRLTATFDRFVASIRETLVAVSESSCAVANASAEISSSTEQMAAGAQEQTSQTNEVASAVEEMTKTIVENSRNALATAEMAKAARTEAETGGRVVQETVSAMRRISEVVARSATTVEELGSSSDQIGKIISVIDDIADQTNLLALNAAIEAARAGDQGRGFAVVADEVRKLAERTTTATKEIAATIKKIQKETQGAVSAMKEGTQNVAAGITLADKAGSSLLAIVASAGKVTEMISLIARAGEEQSGASEQIAKNVEAISNVTGQSAAGTEQIARAAEDLNRLTENLASLVAG